jgi:LytS/YehU family sensor histidine kinase
MAPWVGVATVVGYGFGSTLADLVTGTQRTQGIFGGNPRVLVAILLVSISVSIAATYFFYARGRIAATEARFEAARRAALENQLMLLQSQLEPHMLFNTLANLRVLIGIDPPRAQAMLDRLIAYLRATLGGSRTGMHALADEFARLADYLALMAVRMGPRLQVQLDLPPELAGVQVPALLLQPLVENSIKHGLEPALEGGRIEVSARRDGARLTLAVRDTGAGLRDPAGPQYGTAHVRERLQALYGDAAHFSLEDAAGGGTLARVVLPAEALPGTA